MTLMSCKHLRPCTLPPVPDGCTQAEVEAGTLVIQPMSPPQLREVTDLLTDVFAASEDPVGLYTRWMRGQIRQYLEHHIKVGSRLPAAAQQAEQSCCSANWRPKVVQCASSHPGKNMPSRAQEEMCNRWSAGGA